MCLAQGHNAVTPVRLKPAAPWSRVKHSTTEPLHSLFVPFLVWHLAEEKIADCFTYFFMCMSLFICVPMSLPLGWSVTSDCGISWSSGCMSHVMAHI